MDKEAAQVLKSIADKLDVPVEQLWNGLVAYAPFTYYQWVVTLTVCVAGMIACAMVFIVAFKKASEKGEDSPWVAMTILSALLFIASIVAFSFQVGDVGDSLAAKHAPEAWAAKKVLGRVVR